MSITVTASVVVGFPLEIKEVPGTRTKYDVDTGKPYQVPCTAHYAAICEGLELATDPEAFYEDDEIDGLTLHYGSDYEMWLGEKIAEIASGPGSEIFTPEIPEAVKAFGERHGFTPKYAVILYVG